MNTETGTRKLTWKEENSEDVIMALRCLNQTDYNRNHADKKLYIVLIHN